MRPICALLIYLAAVFLGGALLAPWLYWAVDFTGWMDAIGRPPFHRFVTRSLLLVALFGIWPLLRFSGMTSLRALGLARVPGWREQLGCGCVAGAVSLAVVAAGALITGARAWEIDQATPALGLVVLGALATAIVVAVLEEILFRGAIFGALRAFNHWLVALVISSGIYSVVHFFKRATLGSREVTWTSGVELLPRMLNGFTDSAQILPGFIVLLLAGAVLAAAYHRTGSLHFPIGLHAGWVFVAQTYGVFTAQRESQAHPFWGSARIIDGWCGVVLLTPLLLWFLFRKREPIRGADDALTERTESLTQAEL